LGVSDVTRYQAHFERINNATPKMDLPSPNIPGVVTMSSMESLDAANDDINEDVNTSVPYAACRDWVVRWI
jgi:hypothetical protein